MYTIREKKAIYQVISFLGMGGVRRETLVRAMKGIMLISIMFYIITIMINKSKSKANISER